MGTNYYWRPACDVCGCTHERPPREHIGKSSGGWTFGFHATEEIRSAKQWKQVTGGKGEIVNEYGETIKPEDFWRMVDHRRDAKLNFSVEHPRYGFLDEENNSMHEGEFS